MQFENSYSEKECSGRCPECLGGTAFHFPFCSQCGETAAVHMPNGCDYGHLVGDPAKQHDKEVHGVPWTELLTDYDRILLRFGMHIQWQL